jgi:DNA-binding MarR family transcriptional regulator
VRRVAEDTETQAVVDGLQVMARLMISLTARSLAKLDVSVTLPQLRTLVVLAVSGSQRVVDLAAELQVQPSAATRMCDRLVRKHLVSRHERADDRRVAWVALTSAGRGLVMEVINHRREQLTRLVANVDIADPAAFSAVLHALAEAAGEPAERDWQAGEARP